MRYRPYVLTIFYSDGSQTDVEVNVPIYTEEQWDILSTREWHFATAKANRTKPKSIAKIVNVHGKFLK